MSAPSLSRIASAEEERLHAERLEEYQRQREEDRIAREQRLLSGADCKWTQLQRSRHWYCRGNGGTYRLSPSKDKMWHLYRVQSVSDVEEGVLVGKYRTRSDATKVVAEIAFRPEPKWLERLLVADRNRRLVLCGRLGEKELTPSDWRV
ncbi:MAG: hypothetical protein ACLP19_07500 [Xanthobacteraceae bacterium]